MTRVPSPTRRAPLVVLLAVAGLTALVGCSSGSNATAAHSEADGQGWEHVHNLAVDGDQVLLGTHTGLWQQKAGEQPTLASNEPFDVMGLTRDGPRWLASGHPPPGKDGPTDLGLLESVDGGRTWHAVSLSGEVDFHRLAASGSTIIGLSAHDGTLMRSTDDGLTWAKLGTPPLFDIALDPSDGAMVLATTETGPVRSVDGGVTFTPIAGSPLLMLLAWNDEEVVGIDPSGQLYRSADSGQTWTTAGNVGGEPSALAASTDTVAVLTEDTLLVSTDGAETFAPIQSD